MVKALVSRSGKDLFDLYFSDVRLFGRFVYGEVTVQKPRDFMSYEGLADEVEGISLISHMKMKGT